MSDLFADAEAPTEPAPCPVVRLHPDGIFLREEGAFVWVERRRGSRSTCAVGYTREELTQLRDRLTEYLR